jgi:hypothetical protein
MAKDGRKSLRDAIKEYYENALSGQKIDVAVNNGTIEVSFGNDGKKKTVGRRGLTPRKAATVEYLVQLIGNAKYVYSEKNRKEGERQDVPRFHYFVNGANIDGVNVPIKIIVRDLNLLSGIESRYYTHDVVENKGSTHPGLRNGADSDITDVGKIMEAPYNNKIHDSRKKVNRKKINLSDPAQAAAHAAADEAAVASADRLIRRTQPVFDKIFMPESLRGEDMISRLFSMFLNQQNQNLNNLAEIWAGAKNGSATKSPVGTLKAYFYALGQDGDAGAWHSWVDRERAGIPGGQEAGGSRLGRMDGWMTWGGME